MPSPPAAAVDRGREPLLWRAPGARRRVLLDRAGDLTVLLGLNGAGKSTLFSLMTRLYAHAARPDPHFRS